MANRGLLQAAGSWSYDACCAVHGNDCTCHGQSGGSCLGMTYCHDRTSSSDWLFGLWPGPPQRFEPTGTDTDYQYVAADAWPIWGRYPYDLDIGATPGAPGGSDGEFGGCDQGHAYRGTDGEICGGANNWGATDVEVWYPI